MMQKILVTGATGKQGGALVDTLLKSNSLNATPKWKICALTRDANSKAAQRLIGKGHGNVEVVEGDLNNPVFVESFLTPQQDLHSVFSVQTIDSTNGGVKAEMEQGIRLADAAKKANVKHFVYTSVGGADRNTGIPHFDSKFKIEQHIRSIQLPYTILRPTFFMQNLTEPGMFGKVVGAFFKYQISPDRKLQMINIRDIGEFAYLALENTAKFLGKEIELAGDELTFHEANEIWKKHMNGQDIPVTFSLATSFIKMMSKEMRTMFEWFDKVGYNANIAECKRLYPGLTSFDEHMQEYKKVNV
ncbi:NAD(P)-binding protein [Phlyctochytrium arcticum]|nr:NAD(P)-binding protein [Phlyctochytrium arcticum]